MSSTRSPLSGSILILALQALACSGDSLTVPPTSGTLAITTSISGVEPDADGFSVQVDGGPAQLIDATATLTTPDLTPGEHTVQLADMAGNCSVAGDNPRTVSLTAGETATVTFAVTCGATTGGLSIAAVTSGPSPDADGYTISIDGADRGVLEANGTVTVDALTAGSHSVGLSGIAANCQIQGNNVQGVTVTPGANTGVAYTISCAAPPPDAGSIRITTASSGTDPDPDGYTVSVDGGTAQPLAVNASTTVANLAAGDHSVRVAGVSGNCTVAGTNPRSVTVTSGATAAADFVLSCTATTGTVRVSVTTSGSPTDPNGYTAKLDNANPGKPIATGGNVSFTTVPAGSHAVALSGVATHCAVTGGLSRNVTVAVGATSELAFVVTCAATTGSIRVSVTTSGSPADPDGYVIKLDGDDLGKPIATSGEVSFTGVAEGSHSVALSGQASNCSLDGDNARTVTVTAGAETSATFAVTCRSAGVQWTTIPFPPDFVGSALWASSPSDLFVVGGYQSDPSTATRVVLHYDGNAWTEQLRGMDWKESPSAIWGSSPTDVFAAGGSQVWRYDGGRWVPFHKNDTGDEVEYLAIWGTSPRDLFAVGSAMEATNEGPTFGLIDGYDGATWSQTLWTSVANGGNQAFVQVNDVGGSSPTDVYAVATHAAYRWSETDDLVGIGDVDNAVWHNDGSGWRVSHNIVAPPTSNWTYTSLLRAVWANAPDDVFVVGVDGRILHFNGTAWSPMTSATSQDLADVWGNSASNVFAVGDAGIMHYDGAGWTVSNSTPGNRVWGAGADVFVISQGAVLHGTP